MIIENTLQNQVMVRVTRDLFFEPPIRLIAGNQYRWTKKEYIPPANCNCPNNYGYWKYYLNAFADGCPIGETLEQSYVVIGPSDSGENGFCVEEEYDGKPRFLLTYQEENRMIGKNEMVPQAEQEPGSLYFDENLSVKVGI